MTIEIAPHTASFAGLFGLMLVTFSFNVLRRRVAAARRGLTHNPALEKAIRIHGNFIEYVPFAVILMFVIEAEGAPGLAIDVLGGFLFLSRAFHAYGMTTDNANHPARVIGTHGTFLVLLVESFAALLYGLT